MPSCVLLDMDWKKLIFKGLLCGGIGLGLGLSANGQYARRHFDDYTRFSVEVNAGIPFLVGNLTSFSAEKTYTGLYANVGVGFQYTPVWGFRFSAGYGKTKVGARDYAKEFLLGEDGMTYYLPMPFQTWTYKEIYSEVKFLSAGLHADVNLINLLGGSAAAHWYTVLLSPAVYVQQYKPEVKTKKRDDVLFAPGGKMCLGLGGDLTFRIRMSPVADFQIRTGMVWMTDNQFIGFDTPILARYNYSWNTSVGLVFKIPQKGKRENLMYMPRNGECFWRF